MSIEIPISNFREPVISPGVNVFRCGLDMCWLFDVGHDDIIAAQNWSKHPGEITSCRRAQTNKHAPESCTIDTRIAHNGKRVWFIVRSNENQSSVGSSDKTLKVINSRPEVGIGKGQSYQRGFRNGKSFNCHFDIALHCSRHAKLEFGIGQSLH